MERCDICSAVLETRRATSEQPYRYTEGGVDFVRLAGVDCFRCPACDVETAAIPDIDGLHRLIAEEMLAQPVPLTPREFMYLRKEALICLQELSLRTKVRKETVSAFEAAEIPTLRQPVTLIFGERFKTWEAKPDA